MLAAARCALLGAHRQHIGTGSERRSGTKNCSDADERGTRSGDVDLTEIGIFAASAAATSYSDQLAKRPSALLVRDKRCSAPGTLLQTCCALSRRRACTAGRVAAALLHCQISAALQLHVWVRSIATFFRLFASNGSLLHGGAAAAAAGLFRIHPCQSASGWVTEGLCTICIRNGPALWQHCQPSVVLLAGRRVKLMRALPAEPALLFPSLGSGGSWMVHCRPAMNKLCIH